MLTSASNPSPDSAQATQTDLPTAWAPVIHDPSQIFYAVVDQHAEIRPLHRQEHNSLISTIRAFTSAHRAALLLGNGITICAVKQQNAGLIGLRTWNEIIMAEARRLHLSEALVQQGTANPIGLTDLIDKSYVISGQRTVPHPVKERLRKDLELVQPGLVDEVIHRFAHTWKGGEGFVDLITTNYDTVLDKRMLEQANADAGLSTQSTERLKTFEITVPPHLQGEQKSQVNDLARVSEPSHIRLMKIHGCFNHRSDAVVLNSAEYATALQEQHSKYDVKQAEPNFAFELNNSLSHSVLFILGKGLYNNDVTIYHQLVITNRARCGLWDAWVTAQPESPAIAQFRNLLQELGYQSLSGVMMCLSPPSTEERITALSLGIIMLVVRTIPAFDLYYTLGFALALGTFMPENSWDELVRDMTTRKTERDKALSTAVQRQRQQREQMQDQKDSKDQEQRQAENAKSEVEEDSWIAPFEYLGEWRDKTNILLEHAERMRFTPHVIVVGVTGERRIINDDPNPPYALTSLEIAPMMAGCGTLVALNGNLHKQPLFHPLTLHTEEKKSDKDEKQSPLFPEVGPPAMVQHVCTSLITLLPNSRVTDSILSRCARDGTDTSMSLLGWQGPVLGTRDHNRTVVVSDTEVSVYHSDAAQYLLTAGELKRLGRNLEYAVNDWNCLASTYFICLDRDFFLPYFVRQGQDRIVSPLHPLMRLVSAAAQKGKFISMQPKLRCQGDPCTTSIRRHCNVFFLEFDFYYFWQSGMNEDPARHTHQFPREDAKTQSARQLAREANIDRLIATWDVGIHRAAAVDKMEEFARDASLREMEGGSGLRQTSHGREKRQKDNASSTALVGDTEDDRPIWIIVMLGRRGALYLNAPSRKASSEMRPSISSTGTSADFGYCSAPDLGAAASYKNLHHYMHAFRAAFAFEYTRRRLAQGSENGVVDLLPCCRFAVAVATKKLTHSTMAPFYSSLQNRSRVAVIGAGITGTLTAWMLMKRNHPVTIMAAHAQPFLLDDYPLTDSTQHPSSLSYAGFWYPFPLAGFRQQGIVDKLHRMQMDTLSWYRERHRTDKELVTSTRCFLRRSISMLWVHESMRLPGNVEPLPTVRAERSKKGDDNYWVSIDTFIVDPSALLMQLYRELQQGGCSFHKLAVQPTQLRPLSASFTDGYVVNCMGTGSIAFTTEGQRPYLRNTKGQSLEQTTKMLLSQKRKRQEQSNDHDGEPDDDHGFPRVNEYRCDLLILDFRSCPQLIFSVIPSADKYPCLVHEFDQTRSQYEDAHAPRERTAEAQQRLRKEYDQEVNKHLVFFVRHHLHIIIGGTFILKQDEDIYPATSSPGAMRSHLVNKCNFWLNTRGPVTSDINWLELNDMLHHRSTEDNELHLDEKEVLPALPRTVRNDAGDRDGPRLFDVHSYRLVRQRAPLVDQNTWFERVIHNYGHSYHTYSFAAGCAMEVERIIREEDDRRTKL